MKKILFALCLLLFVSCTRDVVLVLPPVSPRLVLNASVSPDTDVTAFLSKSWFVLDTVTDDGVEDGSIQVFINDRLQGRMQPVSDSRFTGRYVLPGCRVRAGDRLRLEAEAGGFDRVGGETVIPDPVEVLSVDTVRLTRFGYGGYEYPSIRLYVRFRDKPDKRNYYRLIIEKQTEFQKGDSVITCSSMYRSELNYTDWLGVVYEDPVFRSTVTNPVIEQLDGTTCRGTFTDDMFDGKDYTVRSSFWPVDSSFKGDSVTTTVHYDIRLMAISEEYYRYLVVIRNFSISLGDAYLDGLVEPTATYTNVEGGFGIVAGCQLAHRRFTMPFGDKEPSWNPFAVYD